MICLMSLNAIFSGFIIAIGLYYRLKLSNSNETNDIVCTSQNEITTLTTCCNDPFPRGQWWVKKPKNSMPAKSEAISLNWKTNFL